MSIYIIETPSNKLVCKCKFLHSIQLHKSKDLSDEMKKQVKRLRVGEAIQFPNGYKVKHLSDQTVDNMFTYIKRSNIIKGSNNDSNTSSL